MKRFLVFAFDQYYPTGGWDDLVDSCHTVEEARVVGEGTRKRYDEYQIVDTESGEVVV